MPKHVDEKYKQFMSLYKPNNNHKLFSQSPPIGDCVEGKFQVVPGKKYDETSKLKVHNTLNRRRKSKDDTKTR
jgi:hypothetical protein